MAAQAAEAVSMVAAVADEPPRPTSPAHETDEELYEFEDTVEERPDAASEKPEAKAPATADEPEERIEVVEKPAEERKEPLSENPDDKLNAQAVEKADERLMDEPVKPAEKLDDKLVENAVEPVEPVEHVEEPIEYPIEYPIEKAVEQTDAQEVELPMDSPVESSTEKYVEILDATPDEMQAAPKDSTEEPIAESIELHDKLDVKPVEPVEHVEPVEYVGPIEEPIEKVVEKLNATPEEKQAALSNKAEEPMAESIDEPVELLEKLDDKPVELAELVESVEEADKEPIEKAVEQLDAAPDATPDDKPATPNDNAEKPTDEPVELVEPVEPVEPVESVESVELVEEPTEKAADPIEPVKPFEEPIEKPIEKVDATPATPAEKPVDEPAEPATADSKPDPSSRPASSSNSAEGHDDSASDEQPSAPRTMPTSPEPSQTDESESPSASSATIAATSAASAVYAVLVSPSVSPSPSPTPMGRLKTGMVAEDEDMSTLPDPRKRALTAGQGASSPGIGSRQYSADSVASDEVTTLSTKLIDAINYQSTLGDTLSRTRMELAEARAQIQKLEVVAERQKEMVTGGVWVRKATIEQERAQERAQFAVRVRDERRRRDEAEQAKKKMEQELEALTAELFEQANSMVAMAKEEARREQLAATRRHDNLRAQLADTEGLLRSQQEQLAQLKQVMEDMITEGAAAQAAIEANAQAAQAAAQASEEQAARQASASRQAGHAADKLGGRGGAAARRDFDGTDTDVSEDDATGSATGCSATSGSATTPAVDPPSLLPPTPPSYPTSFTHLVRPVLRFDTAAYAEFLDLIRGAQVQMLHQHQQQLHQQTLLPHARSPSSISMPRTPPIMASSSDLAATTPPPSSPAPTASFANPSPSLLSAMPAAIMGNGGSNGSIPSPSSSFSQAGTQHGSSGLKETKFYKRVLVEDIEPALRLDTAPSISWLGRRGIMSAMLEGTLVAEPMPSLGGLSNGSTHSFASAGGSGGSGPSPYGALSASGFSLSPAMAASGYASSSSSSSVTIFSPCALCGESRREEAHLRRHRFRLTESDRSPPYALCGYCLGRVRAVCDFLGFLRMIKDGHWRADDANAEHAAWEEGVRLREQMFWARIGGGVLPVGTLAAENASSSSRVVSSSSYNNSLAGRHSRIVSSQGLGITATPPAATTTAAASMADSMYAASFHSARSQQPPVPQLPARTVLSSSMAALVAGFGGHVV
ncbi:GDP GTP exchange factor [Grosmannia clavigera kw1407]|uniref:GDP GTP exchange factor n=1 Tax=Grosmannia clavigera (strain kw1407 / UAMH 11150) TaxID=655863 RepID=F0XBM2_GROCL|nr:GDP GTP exchange factor [Grosmannia clavigera kw1407]EFX05099.1 GDP GTP exchange factor [Grosmannia clavigera kw1407]